MSTPANAQWAALATAMGLPEEEVARMGEEERRQLIHLLLPTTDCASGEGSTVMADVEELLDSSGECEVVARPLFLEKKDEVVRRSGGMQSYPTTVEERSGELHRKRISDEVKGAPEKKVKVTGDSDGDIKDEVEASSKYSKNVMWCARRVVAVLGAGGAALQEALLRSMAGLEERCPTPGLQGTTPGKSFKFPGIF